MKQMVVITSSSPEQTQLIGQEIGKHLKAGDIVALIGELGTGKTNLTQGISKSLGVTPDQHVTSPAYNLINEYKGRTPVYHIDLYRISDLAEVEDLNLDEYMYGNGVTIIEWAEKMLPLLPPQYYKIDLEWEHDYILKIAIQFIGGEGPDFLRTMAVSLSKNLQNHEEIPECSS